MDCDRCLKFPSTFHAMNSIVCVCGIVTQKEKEKEMKKRNNHQSTSELKKKKKKMVEDEDSIIEYRIVY